MTDFYFLIRHNVQNICHSDGISKIIKKKKFWKKKNKSAESQEK